MTHQVPNKRKIINDPVYGFINIRSDLIFDLIEHDVFQRLRRIKQLGLTNFVYPGANHTRFQHALGACYLMENAIGIIRSKGHDISDEEQEAVMIAILMHDIGHGPFSHALENTLIPGVSHEDLSLMLMNKLNVEFNEKLNLATQIFQNKHPKKFLHQLVSSQLDMDRLDYLRRDSFFTGVTEGIVGSDRIIKMLNVIDGDLVLEAKGIYSIEKYLIARRLMYWQVYLHKTVLAAENLLVKILTRAKELASRREDLFGTPALRYFLYDFNGGLGGNNQEALENFIRLDDTDIVSALKVWQDHSDPVLADLSSRMILRRLYRIKISRDPISEDEINQLKSLTVTKLGISASDIDYYVFCDSISNHTYHSGDDKIRILYNDGTLKEISEASDIFDMGLLARDVKKYFLCYPKEIY